MQRQDVEAGLSPQTKRASYMMTRKSTALRLTLFALLLGVVATVPALAGSAVIGSVAGSVNASVGGQTLLPNTTIFGGDSLQVRNGIAEIAVGNNNRMIFGRDTVASFLRDSNEVTVLLSQGNVSMLHPSDGTPLRVKAGEISITPAAGLKTLGEVAIEDGSVVITAREGALRVEDHGATKNVAMGQTMVIAPKTSKGGAPGTSVILAGAAMNGAGSASTAAIEAASAAASAAKVMRPGPSRPIGAASGTANSGTPTVNPAAAAAAAAAATLGQAPCAPPTVPGRPVASAVFPLAATAGPVCPY